MLALILEKLAMPKKLNELAQTFAAIHWQDLGWSIGVLLTAFLVGRVVSWALVRSIRRWAEHTGNTIEDSVAKHLPPPLRLLVPAAAVELIMPLLSLPVDVVRFLRHFVLIVIILTLGSMCFQLVVVAEEVLGHRYQVSGADNVRARAVQTQLRGFRNIASFVIVVLTLGFALFTFEGVRELGAGILASAGIAGIVLGFAAQRSLATLLAGIQIAVSQPIRVDDVVMVEGEQGRIEEIALTYVVVRLWDLRRLIVPVQYFIEKPFQNWTHASSELVGTVNLYLDYSVPVGELRNELERLLHASEWWDKKSFGVQVTDAGERTMLVRLTMSAKGATELWNLRCEVREKLIAFVQQKYPAALPRVRAEPGQVT